MADIGADPGVAEPRAEWFGNPRVLSTLFFTEMWERFSYYGMRAILVLFMTNAVVTGGMGLDDVTATAIYGLYTAAVYLVCLPGGWIADRLLGLRRSVFWGGCIIASGHFTLAIPSTQAFYLGLTLIVLGTGLLKPNISAIVGDLYPEGGARRDAGFSIFYMGINVGAFFGQIVTGLLGEKFGWHFGFGAAGVGMLIGLTIFATRARKTLGSLGLEPTRDPDPVVQARKVRTIKLVLAVGLSVLILVIVLAAMGLLPLNAQAIGKNMTYVLVGVAVVYFAYLFIGGGLSSDEKKRVGVIFILFVFAAIFWSAFEQAPTSLNLFARDFTDRMLWGFEIPTTWFQSVNSLFIFLLAPFFAALWVKLGPSDLSAPGKFSLGLFFAGLGFVIMIFAANSVVSSGGAIKVSALWLVASYFFQTVGELCLSPVGLSSMTKLSPRKYVGQMMGIWFLASAMGNLIAGLVGGHVDPEKLEQMPTLLIVTSAFWMLAALVLRMLTPVIKKYMTPVKN